MRNVGITAFVFWTVMLGTTVPTPLYPLYERSFGIVPVEVTVLFAVYAVGVVVGLLTLGRLSDQIGRKPVLGIALLLSAAAASLFLVSDNLTMLLVARVISGFSAALATGAGTAAIGEQLPASRKWLGPVLALLANMGGLASGTMLAGILAQWAGHPLRLSWIVDLALIGVGLVGLVTVAETVRRTRPTFRFQRLSIPHEIRGEFIRASAAAGAGFAVLGVLTSVTGILLGTELGRDDPALTGFVVFLGFVFTAAGQLIDRRLPPSGSLPAACVSLVVAAGLIAWAVLGAALAPLLAAAVVVGLGTGTAVSAGLRAIATGVPAARRGEAFSAFFAILYTVLAVPAIGVGVVIEYANLHWAGGIFSLLVALLALTVLISLSRRRPVSG
ncbi:putative MFS family arabinose efflux permease [Asanoa ferruginea]|uniref:Putative MFS family arabinose efflux permease n=1 Tax=Asanoa ferruginea TaxID=53367 RepID=A0A3D9ZBS6_9ACTN|nr:MFS transporter [Asanoa ferruginea]REF94389.1 putative MFS family arabinose efflux permease [Asanoa ferruginea]GIF51093.1 MFS transporter [Asanoa ferruginea]